MESRPVHGSRSGRARSINICPNVALAVGILTPLVFVAYMGRNGVLIFLAMGILLMVRRLDLTMREIQQNAWLYLLPLWCILSLTWSEHPQLSLRHGVQLLVTFAIAASLAHRLSPFIFHRILFLSLLGAGVASLLIGETRDDGIWIGIFDSKNYYAYAMVTLVLCSFALLVDRDETLSWRLAGLFGALLGIPQIVMAESAGAVLASLLVLAAALVLLRASALPPPRRKARIILMVALLLIGLLAAFLAWEGLMSLVIDVTGKDPSLTGRADLWAAAMGEIARAPMLGIGYRAFWVEGNALAEALWAEFYIQSKSGFNFHNLYLSNAVEIGLIGVVLQVLLLACSALLCSRWLLQDGRAPSIFFFMIACFVIVISMVEVPVFTEFNTLSVVALGSVVYGLRAAREMPRRDHSPAQPEYA